MPTVSRFSRPISPITWTNNTIIFSSTKTPQEREFYLQLAVSERLTSRDLQRQIDSSYYERTKLADVKLSPLARVLPQDITSHVKDTYVLEMLNLPDAYLERDLKHQISQNIGKFLIEFGRDFAFMGEEYPLQVGNQDFAIDLLFYNRSLSCLAHARS